MKLSTDANLEGTSDSGAGHVPDAVVESEQPPILRASIGAVLGGVVSASVWAAVSAFLGVEIGILATLTGICTGLGVAVVSNGARGTPFRLISVVASLLSILLA